MMLLWWSAAWAAEDFEGFTFYLGDLHAHSGASLDGGSEDIKGSCVSKDCARAADFIQTAKDNALDFVAITDHTNGRHTSPTLDFEAVRDLVLDGHAPGDGFVTLLGAEVWFETKDVELGHRTLLFFDDNQRLATFSVADGQPTGDDGTVLDRCEDVWAFAESLKGQFGELLLFAHHPAAPIPMATWWECHHDDFEPVVEIYSEHGNSALKEPSYDPLWSGTVPQATVEAALDPQAHGYQMGFVGGTDSHDTRPGQVCKTDTEHPDHPYGGGLTVVVQDPSEGFSRESIYQAMVNRQTYATSGPLLPVVVQYSTGGALLGGMGETLGLPKGQALDVEVRLPPDLSAAIEGVVLVGPDERLELDEAAPGVFVTTVPEPPTYLYVDVTFDGLEVVGQVSCADGGKDESEEHLWLSPNWFVDAASDLDEDGVGFLDGDCDDGNPKISPNVPEDCTSGLDDDCDGLIDVDDPDCDAKPKDTAVPNDTGEPKEADPPPSKGCGCNSSAAWLILLSLGWVRRGRRG